MIIYIRIILFLLISVSSVYGQGEDRSREKYYKDRKYKQFNKCHLVGKSKVKAFDHKNKKKKEEVITIIVEKKHIESPLDSTFHDKTTITIIEEVAEASFDDVLPHPDPVYFRFDSDELDSIDYNQILLAVQHIKDGKKIKLHGHTDNMGSDMYNLHLSKKRAHKIKDLLISLGVDEKHILEVEGFGEHQPAVHNKNAQSRMLNRRVELILL